MPILIRIGSVIALWLLSKWRREPTPATQRIGTLSWPKRVSLVWRLVRDRRVSAIARGAAFLPVLYLVSPIDLLPDFIPILGRLDDALVFGLVVDLMVRAVPSHVLQEHLDKVAPGQP